MGHELRTIDTMNYLRLWLTWTNLGGELKALVAVNN